MNTNNKNTTYYSPMRNEYFNMKTIKKICKKFNLRYELDKKLNNVWFYEK